MDNMTQQNASLVEETASASEEMANQAQELLDMMQRFKITAGKEAAPENKGREARPHYDRVKHEAAKKEAVEKREQKSTGNGNGKGRTERPAAPAANTPDESARMKEILKEEGFEEF